MLFSSLGIAIYLFIYLFFHVKLEEKVNSKNHGYFFQYFTFQYAPACVSDMQLLENMFKT